METWKDIKGYEGFYKVSSLGRVTSLTRITFDGRRLNGRILKIGTGIRGYKIAGLCKNGKMKTYNVYRLVAEAFITNPENKICVNHINGFKTDDRIENLEWVTHKENTQHAYKNGLIKTGDEHCMARKVIYKKTGKVYGSIKSAAMDNNITEMCLFQKIKRKSDYFEYI